MYAERIIWLLVGELIVMNIVFFLTGCGLLEFTETVLEIYMGGTLTEVFGIVVIVSKYLFPNNK